MQPETVPHLWREIIHNLKIVRYAQQDPTQIQTAPEAKTTLLQEPIMDQVQTVITVEEDRLEVVDHTAAVAAEDQLAVAVEEDNYF